MFISNAFDLYESTYKWTEQLLISNIEAISIKTDYVYSKSYAEIDYIIDSWVSSILIILSILKTVGVLQILWF